MGATVASHAAPGAVRGMRKRSCLALFAFLSVTGCDHDPTVLETHPLDLRGATHADVGSRYLTMSDGTRIAVDVYVPQDYPGGSILPTVLEMTRYWRSRTDEIPYTVLRALQRGFAYVVMDERGTGASFGGWSAPLTDRALQDAWEVVDWIVDQPWSNGMVGATGVSYPGMAAHQMAANPHPALRAVVPMSDTYDLYGDLLFPGGAFNEAFLQGWSEIVNDLDRSSTLSVNGETFRLKPVDDDPDGELLSLALAGHEGNLDPYQAFQGTSFRDDPSPGGLFLDNLSTRTLASEIDASGVAIYHWGSWLDAGSAGGIIQAFMESSGPRRAAIGSWTHDLSGNAFTGDGDPSQAHPSLGAQWEEVLNFFDDVLRKGKPLTERILRYYTMGEQRWKSTSTWPIPGTETEVLYLAEGGDLSSLAPSEPTGKDSYQVDFQAASATDPRWLGPLFVRTWYPDRRVRDLNLLVYESAPLQEPREVTGYPTIHLNIASTASDGLVFVYLEDIGPEGSVTYVTEGILRTTHRRVSEDATGWRPPTPHHTHLAADSEPMIPGEVTELAMGMEPTSFLFREGHRIRISIAGQDASVFRRLPTGAPPVLQIHRSSTYPSFLELPIVPRQF